MTPPVRPARLLLPLATSLVRAQRRLDRVGLAAVDAFDRDGHRPVVPALRRVSAALPVRADARLGLRAARAGSGRLTVTVTFRPAPLSEFALALDDDGMPRSAASLEE
ncbi:hypothetical protein ACIA8O_14230 [Kitasatospora sp. NPDC051853]|uniref:hypothetical protein n=1 Tax=Kitasatospora sp. NPDC051853 TaxID=3364058 RepID=UPI0037BCAEFD